MTYQEPSQPASPEAGSEPPASADVQPTTGNVLSGQGGAISGVTGPAGSDDTFDADGNLVVQGQYGTLTIDAQGNYTYVPNPDAPEGVQDVFTYTITDSSGAISTATLTVGVGGVADAAAEAGDTAIPGNVINLPAGVDISDIRVSGNDLIISLPDGSQMTIPNGALFVPRLVAGDIEIPQSSIAALLIESEPDPETGQTPSSGGNFGLDAPPLDPGVPLGDLVPPTEPEVTPPEDEEVIQDEDTQPTVLIFTPDVPAGAVNATASVDESGLPARDGEPEGTLEPQNIETTTGTINFTADDGLASVTINGVVITAVGQQIVGANGILTITSINLATGEIGFSYTVTDNTTDGVDDFEDFSVVVTDVDGDTAIGTLHIDIADDEPIARDDTDTVGADEQTATGNVMTGAGTISGAPGADTVGADNATLTAVSGADGSDATFDADGNLVVHGQYGTLTIDAQGNYTYVLDEGAPDNVQDVFVYTLTDGDGDTETATLTITVPDFNSPPVVTTSAVNVSEEGLVGGNPDNTGTPDTTNSSTVSGNIGLSDPDSDATTVTLGIPAGSFESGGEVVNWVVSADGHTLIGYTGSDPNANHVIEVTIDNAGNYEVVLLAPFDDPNTSIEDSISFTIPVTVSDGTETVPTTILVTVEDDAVVATNDVDTLSEETLTATGNVITGAGTTNPGPDSYGADGPGSLIAVSGAGGSDSTFDAEGNLVVQGQYGTLTIDADGNYTYVLNEGAPDNVQDVFTYTLVDGDGDTDTATLTIIIPDLNSPPIVTASSVNVSEEGLEGGITDTTGTPDTTNSPTASGNIGLSDPDGDATTVTLGIPTGSYESGGEVVNWFVSPDGHTLIGYTGSDPNANHVVEVTIDNAGNYNVVLLAPFDDPNTTIEDAISFTIPVTVSDGTETVQTTIGVTVEDDSPIANPQGSVTGQVDEDALADGNNDEADGDDPGTTVASGAAGSLAALFSVGADEPLQNFALNPDTGSLEAQNLTSNGEALAYDVTGNVVTGYVESGATAGYQADEDGAVFTLEVGADGSWEFTLLDQLDHADGDTENNLDIDFSGMVTAEDADGDPATAAPGTFVIDVDDDMPTTFVPDAAVLDNDTGSALGVTLDLDDGDLTNNVGADQPGTVRFPASLDGIDSTLESGGQPIIYHVSADGLTLYGFVEDGTTEGFQADEDDTIFTITLDPDSSTYDVVMDGHVDSTSSVEFFDDAYDFTGGNDPWAGFVPDGQAQDKPGGVPVDDNSSDLLITPFSATGVGNAVNLNAFSAGASGGGGGQNVGAGEGLRLDFVIDLTGNPAGSPANYDGNPAQQDHDFDEHYEVNDVSVRFGDGSTDTTIALRAYDANENVDDTVLGNGTLVSITEIVINYDGESQVFTLDPDNLTQTLTVGSAGGLADRIYTVEWVEVSPGVYTVEVTGILDAEVRIATHGETDYEALEIEHVSGDDFAITGFGASVASTDPVNFTVPVELVDADGDAVAGTDLDITINPVEPVAPLTMMSSTQSVQSDSAEAGLVPSNASNDNEGFQRALASGSNAALMGAIAAVGLAETRGVHIEQLIANSIGDSPMAEAQQIVAQALAGHSTGQAEAGILLQQPGDSLSAPTAQNGGGRFQEVMDARGMDSHVRSDVARDLTQSTDAGTPAQEAVATTLTAASVAMPSADQMMDAPVSQVAPVQGSLTGASDSVGKVLADALQGGDAQGPNLDALINALPDHGGGGSAALEALASHGGGAVPNGHMADLAGFAGGRNAAIIDEMEVHQDALPPNG